MPATQLRSRKDFDTYLSRMNWAFWSRVAVGDGFGTGPRDSQTAFDRVFPIILIAEMSSGVKLAMSSVKDRIFEIWVPRDRWIPEQSTFFRQETGP